VIQTLSIDVISDPDGCNFHVIDSRKKEFEPLTTKYFSRKSIMNC